MRFRSKDLLSKWGFEDGDILIDFLHDHGISIGDVDHGQLLQDVLVDQVLPLIRNDLVWERISSMHNKIKVTSVDGVPNDHLTAYRRDTLLVPEYVDVPKEVILAYAEARSGREHVG